MQITIFSVWMTFVWCNIFIVLCYILRKTIGSAEFIQYDRNHHFIFVLSDQACRPGGIAMDESGIRRQPV